MEIGAGVTSLTMVGKEVVVGTVASDIYQIKLFLQPQRHNQTKSNKPRAEVQHQTRKLQDKKVVFRDNKTTQRRRGIEHSSTILTNNDDLKLDYVTPELHLLSTCHSEPINDVIFPR